MANPQFSIWEQARNTARVRRAVLSTLEQQPRPARQLARLVPTTDDKIIMERMDVAAAGIAPLKAIGATPQIYAPKFAIEENAIELVQISEMRPIDERLYRKLQSTDEKLRERAGADILLTARQMALRNENRSDLMVMTAVLTGQLLIAFVDEPDQGMVISYDYDPTHLVNASNWQVLGSSTPIADLRAAQELLANDSGDYGIHFWMNTDTYDNIIWSNEAKVLLTGSERAQNIPQNADINQRLFEGSRVEWHVTDAGWRTEGEYARGRSVINKWIPDNKVLMTTANPFEGEPLVEMFDGMVMVRTGFDSIQLRQGSQTYAKIDDSDTYYWVQTSTRMPRINRPECIAVLDVGP